jgi:hypothetical protein
MAGLSLFGEDNTGSTELPGSTSRRTDDVARAEWPATITALVGELGEPFVAALSRELSVDRALIESWTTHGSHAPRKAVRLRVVAIAEHTRALRGTRADHVTIVEADGATWMVSLDRRTGVGGDGPATAASKPRHTHPPTGALGDPAERTPPPQRKAHASGEGQRQAEPVRDAAAEADRPSGSSAEHQAPATRPGPAPLALPADYRAAKYLGPWAPHPDPKAAKRDEKSDRPFVIALAKLETLAKPTVDHHFHDHLDPDRGQWMRIAALHRANALWVGRYMNEASKRRPVFVQLGPVWHRWAQYVEDPATGALLIKRGTRHRPSEARRAFAMTSQARVSAAVLRLEELAGGAIVDYRGTAGPALTIKPKDCDGDATLEHRWYPGGRTVIEGDFTIDNVPVRAYVRLRSGGEILLHRRPANDPDNNWFGETFAQLDSFHTGWHRVHARFTGRCATPTSYLLCDDEHDARCFAEVAHHHLDGFIWDKRHGLGRGCSPARDRVVFVPETWLAAGDLRGYLAPKHPPRHQKILATSDQPRIIDLSRHLT